MAQGGEQEERVNVTFSLPTRLASAITKAAHSAGRLTPDGHVVMDHMVMVPSDFAQPTSFHQRVSPLLLALKEQGFEGPSNHLLNPD